MPPLPNPADIPALIGAIERLIAVLQPFTQFGHIAGVLLKDSVGLLLAFWRYLLLGTADFPSGDPFTQNQTIATFEPPVRAIANGLLVLVAIWASYRIMWSHGLRSQFTARVLLPRLFMGGVLINFSVPMFQAAVDANNTLCSVIEQFGTIPTDWSRWLNDLPTDPAGPVLQLITTTALVVGYDVLALAYMVRYTILIFLAITAPFAGLLFVLPDTIHLAKLWRKLFVTNLFMQPIQLFVLAVGFALEKGPTPVHYVFAIAALLVVFKVPGAMGTAEHVAHKLESTFHTAATHLERAVVRAV